MDGTTWLIASAGLAGLAVALVLHGPRRRAELLGDDQAHDRDRLAALRRLLGGRPGAASLRLRILAGFVIMAAVIMIGLVRLPELGLLIMLPACGTGLGVVVATGWVETGSYRRRRRQLIMDLPQTLALLGAAVGAGLPLRGAVREVAAASGGPIADDLRRVLAQIELGRPEEEAWRDLRRDPVWAPVAVDLARSVESGTRLAEGLRRHAEFARQRRRAAIEIVARAVGVRSVLPLMACFVPAFILIGIVPTVASALLKVFGPP
ncbi:type II secretion system F family protein [Microlunatus parietis]|uniref:Pilus assembly protein TadC n=1 Tax=Microlunatus parietis TaxID=682979 RepID=A0A7Y9I7N5_9ACTN|nr:type II secretion system F family protein [Microlunatus parietis]NYE71618.1 pilus assembly protein TadC [Microlunatus parietis]